MEDSWLKICTENTSIYSPFVESYRQQMFDKLVDDRYLEKRGESNEYRVTFNGIKFNQENGYLGEDDRKKSAQSLLEKNIVNQNEMHPLQMDANKTSVDANKNTIKTNKVTKAVVWLTAGITVATLIVSFLDLHHEYKKDNSTMVIDSLRKQINLDSDAINILRDSLATIKGWNCDLSLIPLDSFVRELPR